MTPIKPRPPGVFVDSVRPRGPRGVGPNDGGPVKPGGIKGGPRPTPAVPGPGPVKPRPGIAVDPISVPVAPPMPVSFKRPSMPSTGMKKGDSAKPKMVGGYKSGGLVTKKVSCKPCKMC